MASPEPYRDSPTSNHYSNPAADYELTDYYDNIPPAHRLSGIHDLSSYPSNPSLSLNSSRPSDTPSRGAYIQPLAATSAADIPIMPTAERNYANLEPTDNWMEKPPTRSKRTRWIVIGSILGVIGLAAIGIAVGVTLSEKAKKSSSSASGQTDSNDPSSFQKDSRLHQSFYGLAYTPAGSQLPNCGNNLSDVISDIQIMSQLTTRIRLYGADCNQTELVLEAIKQTKVNMSVYVANYPIATDGGAAYQRQLGELQTAIQAYGTSNIPGMTVGNEFILDYLAANGGGTDPNSAVGDQGAAILDADISNTRTTLQGMGLSSMLVGTSDAGAYFNTEVLQSVDYGMANVHPWFANVSITDAAAWTANFFQTQNVEPAAKLSNNPKMYIAETGWPTASADVSNESNGPSTATEGNLQTFLDTFICQANQNGTGYFYFETFDEPWKNATYGGVEGFWGMFYANKTLKGITIPNCPLS